MIYRFESDQVKPVADIFGLCYLSITFFWHNMEWILNYVDKKYDKELTLTDEDINEVSKRIREVSVFLKRFDNEFQQLISNCEHKEEEKKNEGN